MVEKRSLGIESTQLEFPTKHMSSDSHFNRRQCLWTLMAAGSLCPSLVWAQSETDTVGIALLDHGSGLGLDHVP